MPEYKEYIFKAVFSFLVITNAFGNSLVILLIVRKRSSMTTPVNYLLLNLAAADLIFGVFMVPPFVLTNTFDHPQGVAGDILCKVLTTGNVGWVGAFSSVFSLVVVAFERYYAVMKPLTFRHKYTAEKLKVIIAICWTAAIAHNIPAFVADRFDADLQVCVKMWPVPWFGKFHSLLSLLAGALLPGVIMTVLYSRVIHRLWFGSGTENSVTVQAVRKTRKKITKTMLILSAMYAFCWFPDLVMYVLTNFFPQHIPYDSPYVTAVICLAVLNSSLNPVLYALRFKRFREEMGKMICCRKKCFFNIVPLRRDGANIAVAGRMEMRDTSQSEKTNWEQSVLGISSRPSL